MTISKRLNYIDNLRSLTVSLLIIYHLAMAYNTWGEPNYIFFGETKSFSAIVVLISPWFMPLMFLLAGIGAYYSLKKRSFSTFIKERLIRLGISFVFGLLLINPILSFVADVTHNGYKGKRKICNDFKEKLIKSNCVSKDENAVWLIDYWCGSCRTNYNTCSFATISSDGKCPNAVCCQERVS